MIPLFRRFLPWSAIVLIFAVSGCQKASPPAVTFFKQFDATLQPQALQGFEIAPTVSEKCIYLAKISPADLSNDGASIKYFIEPECNGKQWHQVIRITLDASASAPVKVHVVVYKISGGEEPANKVYP